jgi:hypothetical protein
MPFLQFDGSRKGFSTKLSWGALTAMEKLQVLLEEEEKWSMAWKRLPSRFQIFAYEDAECTFGDSNQAREYAFPARFPKQRGRLPSRHGS